MTLYVKQKRIKNQEHTLDIVLIICSLSSVVLSGGGVRRYKMLIN